LFGYYDLLPGFSPTTDHEQKLMRRSELIGSDKNRSAHESFVGINGSPPGFFPESTTHLIFLKNPPNAPII
jgi:hypothetical protein